MVDSEFNKTQQARKRAWTLILDWIEANDTNPITVALVDLRNRLTTLILQIEGAPPNDDP